MNIDSSILWRRHDAPGHDFARLQQTDVSWMLSGVALFDHEGMPCSLMYSVDCDASWLTRSAKVSGWIGARAVDIVIAADGTGSWTLNGESCPSVRGSFDVDLNFTPSTNLLPIRRVSLPVGAKAEVRAAWLRFPSLTLELLVQTYTRTGERTYRYQSTSGFSAELSVNEHGFPTSYGDLWSCQAAR